MARRPGNGAGANPPGRPHRIVGIDPGTVHTGWGVVETADGALHCVAHGIITSAAGAGQAERLHGIYRGLLEVLSRYEPHGISLEKVFFARNAQSALKLGQARGVALLAAAEREIAAHEYSSAEIKLAVVGYGQATKGQVQVMVGSLLGVTPPIPADAADALAAALCHLHQYSYRARLREALAGEKKGPSRWRI